MEKFKMLVELAESVNNRDINYHTVMKLVDTESFDAFLCKRAIKALPIEVVEGMVYELITAYLQSYMLHTINEELIQNGIDTELEVQ